MKAVLERLESSDQGTFGRITFGGMTLFTGELPDRNNASNASCIPAGTYICRWTYSEAFKRTMYLVDGVPNRAGIRIHSANFMGDNPPYKKQLHGCIALGERLGTMDGQKAILLSAPAVRRLETAMNRQTFELEIVDARASGINI